MKVVIKICAERGFIPLYVKSFLRKHHIVLLPIRELTFAQDFGDNETAMEEVFEKARQMSPCVVCPPFVS